MHDPDDPSDDRDDLPDDYITRAVLADCALERLRVRRIGTFKQPVPRKLSWLSGLLLALALALPLTATFPASVRQTFPGADPVAAAPKVLVLGLVGGIVVVAAGAVLIALEVARHRLAPVSESRAWTMLNLEEVASLVGFVTGGAAIVLTDGFLLMGHGGAEALGTYLAVVGGEANPLAPVAAAPDVVTVAGGAFVAGLLMFTASQYFALRERLAR